MSLINLMQRPTAANHQRAPWVKNSVQAPSRVTSSCEDYYYLSSSAAQMAPKTIYGGTHMDDITAHQKRVGASTSTNTDIMVNRIGHALHGTTLAERVGITHDKNPIGLTEFESSYQYARVKKAIMTFEFMPASACPFPILFYVLIYRADEGLPAFSIGNDTTAAHSSVNRVAHFKQCTWYPNKGDVDVLKPVHKKIVIDVPKMYNDLEWTYDPVTNGNFWVAKDGDNLFTSEPTADVLCRVYGLVLNPDGQGSTESFTVGVHTKWIMEFDRGDQVLPTGASA